MKAFLLAAALGCFAVLPGDAHAQQYQATVFAPGYSYPTVSTSHWDADSLDYLDSVWNHEDHPKFLIFNPASGPGSSSNSDYVTAIDDAHEHGIMVLGYIATTYGAKDLEDVYDEVGLYVDFYESISRKLDGFFFDEADFANNSTKKAYYDDIWTTVHGIEYFVVMNPGQPSFVEYYAARADVIINFEGTATTFNGGGVCASFPAWQATYPQWKWGIIVHGLGDFWDYLDLFGYDTGCNMGYFYGTDDVLPNPFDVRPSWWTPPSLRGGGRPEGPVYVYPKQ